MSIRPLPPHVAEKIQSSVIITSLNDVASGLVKNSLDAEATSINVSLDYAKGGCSVEDDGLGIPPSEFRPDGGLGKPHHTSKLDHPSECHGLSGDFLAAVASLSLLSVTSHHHKHHSHNSLSIHQSAVVSRHTPALPEERVLSFSHGTRVSVRDLFGSMPVRARQRPGVGDRQTVEKEWRRLLREIVGLLLAWCVPVSVHLAEANLGLQARFRPPQPLGSGLGLGPSPQSILPQVSRTLVQAHLADAEDSVSWERVGGSAAGMTVTGCVSLNPAPTRRAQFICLGIQPIPGELGSGSLYEEVNRVFSNSSFALVDDSADNQDASDPQRSRSPMSIPDRRQRLKRGVDRWPMFFFKVDLEDRARRTRCSVNQFLDQGHRVEAVTDLLKAICYEFLKKHHFKPRSDRGSALEGYRSLQSHGDGPPMKRSRLSTAPTRQSQKTGAVLGSDRPSFFDSWNRVKAGNLVQERSAGKSRASDSAATRPESKDPQGLGGASTPLLSRSGRLLCAPFASPAPCTVTGGAGIATTAGHASSGTPSGHAKVPNSSPATRHIISTGRPPPRQDQTKEPSEWVQNLLKDWRNPVFEPAEPPIPTAQPLRTVPGTLDNKSCRALLEPGPSLATLKAPVSRRSLKSARVISQVDKKFILVKIVPTSSRQAPPQRLPPFPSDSSMLVIIDQHAADERCRLEDLTRAYFAPDPSGSLQAVTEPLATPIQFEIPQSEAALLRRFRENIAHWGIAYSVVGGDGKGDGAPARVVVLGLPPSIAERCRQEPRLLIDLLRAEIWRLEERPFTPPVLRRKAMDGDEWVSRFNGCPQGILDLLNSRACRSAIMFNDSLTQQECADLVARLAECAFPFQCAHGRPSMVPLLDLGGVDHSLGDLDSKPVSWKTWLQRAAQ